MPPNAFRVLVGTDFSETASLALDSAIEGALRSETPELHVVSVVDDGTHHLLPDKARHLTLTQTVDRVRELLSADIAAAISRAPDAKALSAKLHPIVHVRLGSIAEQIAALAIELRADLVIVGTHGRRGIRRAIMGSVSERTVRLAPCPVLVVRPKDFHAMDGLPAIDAACPACLTARAQSGGARWWCAAHETAPEAAHTYSYSRRLDDPPTPLHHVL